MQLSTTYFILLISGLSVSSAVVSETVKELTENDFYDVVLDTNINVLVEFYSDATTWSQNYAPTYAKLAKVFKDEQNCIVAKVNVNKYRQLGKIYEWGGFMKFWFFAADVRQDGVLYKGGRTLEELVKFLNEKCGTNRKKDGGLDVSKGRLASYDKLASTFIQTVVKTNLTVDDIGVYYVNTMKKITEQGVKYVDTEMSRLETILGGYMRVEKRGSTISRLNVLKFFKQLIDNEQHDRRENTEEEEINESSTDNQDNHKEKESPKNADDIIKSVLNGGATSGVIEEKEL